jgi:hypothetical protein
MHMTFVVLWPAGAEDNLGAATPVIGVERGGEAMAKLRAVTIGDLHGKPAV